MNVRNTSIMYVNCLRVSRQFGGYITLQQKVRKRMRRSSWDSEETKWTVDATNGGVMADQGFKIIGITVVTECDSRNKQSQEKFTELYQLLL